ncbi:hypothetical protein C4564_02595 [Candidatus Microgenomates bacterium]|nr:MAG: hypothetical protein C4564_02595 [Candidatus Microgenomates bacterium]
MATNKTHNKKTRPTLAEENKSLKESIKGYQDENENLRVENAVLKERLSNFGLRDLMKNLGFLGIGSALGVLVNGQFLFAAIIAILSALDMAAFGIYESFSKNINGKEKVGE